MERGAFMKYAIQLQVSSRPIRRHTDSMDIAYAYFRKV
jgi:hypothetical protein